MTGDRESPNGKEHGRWPSYTCGKATLRHARAHPHTAERRAQGLYLVHCSYSRVKAADHPSRRRTGMRERRGWNGDTRTREVGHTYKRILWDAYGTGGKLRADRARFEPPEWRSAVRTVRRVELDQSRLINNIDRQRVSAAAQVIKFYYIINLLHDGCAAFGDARVRRLRCIL